jgi:hypothetical protein
VPYWTQLFGIINTELGMNASFAEGMPSVGGASLVSQSGAMAVAMIDWAYESGLGFQKIISMGNKAGVTENDFLEYLGSEPKTKVILMYLESIDNGSDFMRIAKKSQPKKADHHYKIWNKPGRNTRHFFTYRITCRIGCSCLHGVLSVWYYPGRHSRRTF